tara:strand:- start:283 stop:1374 length:1092 start_codon:yes stop_codon:yes gene_type:complete
MIVASTFATKRYAYAIPNFGRRICSALANSHETGLFIFVSDESEQIKELAAKWVESLLPSGWDYEHIALPLEDNLKNYKEEAQLLISQMQSAALTRARQLRASYFWSIESDVLVPPNALNVSMDCLNFDNGYYDIAMCTYPSQGGGSFLGGRGTVYKHIEDDFGLSERDLPKELIKEIKNLEKVKLENRDKKWHDEYSEKIKKSKEYPPKGNVYELNAKQWKKRGWLEFAYPAIGKGATLPTDWVGMGCTLLSEKALQFAHFDGYEGFGTQDLYLCWHRWHPAGLKMCVSTHAICDHVIRQRKGDDQIWEDFVVINAMHEQNGDYEGHLRQRPSMLYTFEAGEKPHVPKEPEKQPQDSTQQVE